MNSVTIKNHPNWGSDVEHRFAEVDPADDAFVLDNIDELVCAVEWIVVDEIPAQFAVGYGDGAGVGTLDPCTERVGYVLDGEGASTYRLCWKVLTVERNLYICEDCLVSLESPESCLWLAPTFKESS